MSVRVTSKGQITIPKRVRDALGIKSGTELEILLENGCAIITPIAGGVEALAGSLRKYLPKGVRIDELAMEQVRMEVAHAAAREGLPRRHKRSS